MRTLLLSLLFCLPLLAQAPEVEEPPPPPPPDTQPGVIIEEIIPAPKRPPAPQPPVLVTMRFPGGTMADFVLTLRQQEPKANVMVAAAAADAVLPALELRGAGLSQVLQSACAVAESHLEIRVKESRGEGEAVFAITARALPPAQDPFAARAQRTKVFSLSRLLESKENAGMTPSTVLSAIETAVGGPDLLTALRYHKESGVLIVRGTDEQIGVCSELLLQLERDAEARRRQENVRKGIPNEPPVVPDARK